MNKLFLYITGVIAIISGTAMHWSIHNDTNLFVPIIVGTFFALLIVANISAFKREKNERASDNTENK
jgi:hypothetical protein